jgi:hypothetical protein
MPERPPIPVRALWETASIEQKEKAHQTGVAILEYWTGRITKTEVATRLGIPQLRVWQLAQQATSGMLAGLLIQPKTRVKGLIMDPAEDPKILRKRIADLEATIRHQDLLISVLRTMPGCRDVTLPMETQAPAQGEKTSATAKPSKATKTAKVHAGARNEDRKMAPATGGEKR